MKDSLYHNLTAALLILKEQDPETQETIAAIIKRV